MNDIRKRKNELLEETWRLKRASFEINKKGDKRKNYERTREIMKQEKELWKKKMFYENYLKEMEKQK